MKIAIIHVECCRECPYAEDIPEMYGIRFCTQQDKNVEIDEIDESCPLEDVTWV